LECWRPIVKFGVLTWITGFSPGRGGGSPASIQVTHRGIKAHLGVLEAHLKPWRLTLELCSFILEDVEAHTEGLKAHPGASMVNLELSFLTLNTWRLAWSQGDSSWSF